MKKTLFISLLASILLFSACSFGNDDTKEMSVEVGGDTNVQELTDNNSTVEIVDETKTDIVEEIIYPAVENIEEYEKIVENLEVLSLDVCKEFKENKKLDCEKVVKAKATINDAISFKNTAFCDMIQIDPFRSDCFSQLADMGILPPVVEELVEEELIEEEMVEVVEVTEPAE